MLQCMVEKGQNLQIFTKNAYYPTYDHYPVTVAGLKCELSHASMSAIRLAYMRSQMRTRSISG